MKKIFITGSSGFVGTHLTEHLKKAGYDPQTVSRLDLGDPFSVKDWEKALHSAESETVIHLIAKTHTSDAGDPSALPSYMKVNVEITAALLRACRNLGVKKFIYLSSIKAVGEETPIDEPFTEGSPCHPEDCYGISKLEAEKIVNAYAANMDTIILRPPLIYGPGVKGNFLKLIKTVNKGIPLPFANIRNARSLLYVENLNQTIQMAIQSKSSGGKNIFHIADPEAPSTTELLQKIAINLEKPCRLFPFPPGILELTASLFGKGDTIKKLTRSLVIATENTNNTLISSSCLMLDSALKPTIDWFINARK